MSNTNLCIRTLIATTIQGKKRERKKEGGREDEEEEGERKKEQRKEREKRAPPIQKLHTRPEPDEVAYITEKEGKATADFLNLLDIQVSIELNLD